MTTPKKHPDFGKLEELLKFSFNDKSHLEKAFIHRSYLNEHKNFKGTSNERLEFLGDSILSLVVSRFIYEKLPESTEGKLTTIRAALVRTETLAKLAKKLSLGSYLLLSNGEEESGGRSNTSTLANTFEALLGAIYLDLGLETVRDFLQKIMLNNWELLAKSAVSDNKSKLQEVLQRKFHISPHYKLIKSWGPDHARRFEIGVFQGDKILGSGTGKNKQIAAQDAAKTALAGLSK